MCQSLLAIRRIRRRSSLHVGVLIFVVDVAVSVPRSYCGECIKSALRANAECPLCRTSAHAKELKAPPPPPASAASTEQKESDAASSSDATGPAVFTSKVDALILQLRVVREQDPRTKSLVFSGFTKSIRILETRLREEGFSFAVLHGSMTAPQRKAALDRFINDEECTCFLLSIRSGAVGLTLTVAQHVYIMEPQQNPAITLQAINRVHRVGQTKEVFIHHLVMVDSIEERIIAMTQSKLETSVADDEKALSSRGKDNYRLKLEELTALFE
jgi:SNF2 family DNA or RNA helicase